MSLIYLFSIYRNKTRHNTEKYKSGSKKRELLYIWLCLLHFEHVKYSDFISEFLYLFTYKYVYFPFSHIGGPVLGKHCR